MNLDEDLAEILGMHLGDGCISLNKKYSEYYLGGDLKEEKEYHDNWVSQLFNKKIMLPLYSRKIQYKEHPKVGIYGFHIFDKKIVEFFKKLGVNHGRKISVKVPKQILRKSSLSKRFIRGLFDTDGNIYFDKNRSCKKPINNVPNIKLDNISKPLIDDVYKILVKLGLHPRIKKPYQGKGKRSLVYTLLIYRKADIEFFVNKIGFKNSKHLTKWQVYQKLGHCPPRTTLVERKNILQRKNIYK